MELVGKNAAVVRVSGSAQRERGKRAVHVAALDRAPQITQPIGGRNISVQRAKEGSHVEDGILQTTRGRKRQIIPCLRIGKNRGDDSRKIAAPRTLSATLLQESGRCGLSMVANPPMAIPQIKRVKPLYDEASRLSRE
jgi:hypothetical protein